MEKAGYEAFVAHLFHLAQGIGIRPAARALGISEDRARKIAQRRNFRISLLRPHANHNATPVPSVTSCIEAAQRVMQQHSTRTALGFAQAATTVAEGLSEKSYGQLIAPGTAISAEQWNKISDRTHGWSADRQKGTQVQVAVVSMPTPEEREERRAMHRRLDAIAARLAVDS